MTLPSCSGGESSPRTPARAEAVAKRHERGGRTARENVADLIDEGSWVEYGRYATAQQRHAAARRT